MDGYDLLHNSGLFDGIDDDTLTTLFHESAKLAYETGTIIIREGEPGDSLYLILDGEVQIFRERPGQDEVVLRRRGVGEYFGERALLPGRTGRRGASVRAATSVQLCRIDKKTFQSHLANNDPLKKRLDHAADQQIIEDFAAESRLIGGLWENKGLVNLQENERSFAAGEVIFRQGDEAEALYLVLEGTVGIFEQRGDEELPQGTLEPGRCFGELALLNR